MGMLPSRFHRKEVSLHLTEKIARFKLQRFELFHEPIQNNLVLNRIKELVLEAEFNCHWRGYLDPASLRNPSWLVRKNIRPPETRSKIPLDRQLPDGDLNEIF